MGWREGDPSVPYECSLWLTDTVTVRLRRDCCSSHLRFGRLVKPQMCDRTVYGSKGLRCIHHVRSSNSSVWKPSVSPLIQHSLHESNSRSMFCTADSRLLMHLIGKKPEALWAQWLVGKKPGLYIICERNSLMAASAYLLCSSLISDRSLPLFAIIESMNLRRASFV